MVSLALVLASVALLALATAHPAVQPKGYRVHLHPDLEHGLYRARVKIDIVNRGAEPIGELRLHVDPSLKINDAEIKLTKLADDDLSEEESEEDLDIKVNNVEHKENVLQLGCSQNLERDATYQLDIPFEGQISYDYDKAFFRDSYTDLATGDTRWFAVLSPRNGKAHQVFPCFDQPALKSWFELTVVHKDSYSALSNTPVMQQLKLDETGENKVVFSRTPQMSIESLGLLVSAFKMPHTDYLQTDGVKIGVWGREDVGISLSRTQALLPSVLVSLELYLSRPYPLQHLDFVALPLYLGDKPVDSWGLQFFKESDLMDSNSYWLTNKVAKASALQWVGHLASPLNHTDRILTNSLASFLANLVTKQLEPTHNSWSLNSFHTLVLEVGKVRKVLDPHQINYLKETKISLLMQMFEEIFGATTFKQALQNFLAKKEFKTYRESDVWQILTEQAWVDDKLPKSLTLGQITSHWLKKRIPLVTVSVDYNKNQTTFTQEEFVDGLESSSLSKVVKKGGVEKNAGWWIPLRIREGNRDPRTVAWLAPDRHSLLVSNVSLDSYIILNPASTGPYLVNYDGETWKKITDEYHKLPAEIRAQLIHDSLTLALTGHLQSVTALQVVGELKQEQSPEVWRSFFPLAERLRKIYQGTSVSEKLDELIRALLIPVEKALGDEDKQAWKSELRTKTQFLLCQTGHPPCVRNARTQFSAWMNRSDPDEGMPLSNSYLCPILSFGDYNEWEFALDRLVHFPKNRTRMEKNYLLKAVAACPKDPKKFQTLINITLLDDNYRQTFSTEERFHILTAVASESAGNTALFQLLSTQWQLLKTKFEGNLWEFLIQTATGGFKTEEELKQVKELAETKKEELGTGGQEICEESIRRIEARVKWNKENGPAVERWLDSTLAAPWTHQRFKFQDVIVSQSTITNSNH